MEQYNSNYCVFISMGSKYSSMGFSNSTKRKSIEQHKKNFSFLDCIYRGCNLEK